MKSGKEPKTLREYRINVVGVTPLWVGEQLGLSERHVRKLESGQSPMKRLHAVGFAYAYSANVETILALKAVA